MKKQISLGLAVVAAVFLLAACGSDKTSDSSSTSSSSAKTEETSSTAKKYQDGTYKVEASDFDDKGWKEYVELTIKDNKISTAVFNAMDKDGNLKTDNAEYKEKMEAANNTYPEKYMKELTDQLVEKQSVDSVDVVTGATHSSDDFKKMATEALNYAEKGETGTHTIDLSK